MSHNVELAGVEFKDISVLEQAVNELVREGVIDARFEKGGNVTIRGWRGAAGEGIRYGNSAWDKEMNHQCEAGIIFNSGKYDIGFNKKPDGTLVPFMESSFVSPLAADRDAQSVQGEGISVTHGMHALAGQTMNTGGNVGKLTQRYAVIMAERNARKHSMTTRRIKGEHGKIQLVVAHR